MSTYATRERRNPCYKAADNLSDFDTLVSASELSLRLQEIDPFRNMTTTPSISNLSVEIRSVARGGVSDNVQTCTIFVRIDFDNILDKICMNRFFFLCSG